MVHPFLSPAWVCKLSSWLYAIRQGGVQLLFNKDEVLVSMRNMDVSQGIAVYRRKKKRCML